jgi:hypothetical protein
VEAYFTETDVLNSSYWIGLERVDVINSLYAWLDGRQVGNGYASNIGGSKQHAIKRRALASS